LEKSASHWPAHTGYPGITWTQFRERFFQYFLAATVMNLLNGRPTEGESMSLYGNRVVKSLTSKLKSLTVEQILVSVALAHVTGTLQILAIVLIWDHSFEAIFHAAQDSYIKRCFVWSRNIEPGNKCDNYI